MDQVNAEQNLGGVADDSPLDALARRERLRKLIVAIVSRVEAEGGTVTGTKLLMLLYLFDIEWYRTRGETYTGFDWYFDPVIHGGVP